MRDLKGDILEGDPLAETLAEAAGRQRSGGFAQTPSASRSAAVSEAPNTTRLRVAT
jgi:hypothetical protein